MNLTDGSRDKYADIDAELEAEFTAELEEEIEALEETEEVDTEVEATEEVEAAEVEVTEDDTQEDEGEPSREIEDTPANRAFAEQRLRIKELEEAQAKKDQIIQMVMQGSGLEDEEQFVQALEQAMAQQEQQALQMDDASYAALDAERKKAQEYQEQLKQRDMQIQERNLFDFDNTLTKYEKDYGFTRDEIFNALTIGNVSIDDIRASNNHDLLIKTHMVDRIAEVKAKKIIEQESKRGTVDSKKLSGTSADTGEMSFEDQQEALLDKEIEAYIKSKKY